MHRRRPTISPPPVRGYTIMEVLIVCAILVAVLSIGVISANAMLARSNIRHAEQTIISALRLARQHAISSRTRCMVELVVINDNTHAREAEPGTPYLKQHDGEKDRLRIYAYMPYRDPETSLREYLLQPVPLREFELPANIVFDDEKGSRRFYPENIELKVDFNRDGRPDPQTVTKICFDFEPDGTCCSRAPRPANETQRQNLIGVRDMITGETSAVCVLPASIMVRKP